MIIRMTESQNYDFVSQHNDLNCKNNDFVSWNYDLVPQSHVVLQNYEKRSKNNDYLLSQTSDFVLQK